MSIRWKKVWGDFWGNKSRTILTIMTIAVGTFAVGFNSNLANYMLESMDGDYLSANPSEAVVYTSQLDEDFVELARKVPGVDAVEGRSTASGNVVQENVDALSIQFTALEEPDDLTLNKLKPVPGEANLPTLNDKQVLVDASAKSAGYETGDILVIELDDGKQRELVLAGYVHDVTGFPFGFTNTFNAYVTPDTIEWLGGTRNYNALAISVSEKQTNQEHVTAVAQAVADEMKRAGAEVYFVSVYQPGHHFAWEITQGVFFVLTVFSYMTVLLSCFLIINTITALMTQQVRQIGIMKAIGGETQQILGMYILLVFTFGLGALLIGIPLANSAAESIGGGMAAWLNFTPGEYHNYPSTLIQQSFVALFVPLLTALFPIRKSVRTTVREAINDYGLGEEGKIRNKPVNKRFSFIPRPIQLSLRNAVRRKARLALTLFTLVLAGAIFIGVYNLWESFDRTIEAVQGYILADINISFGRYYRFEEVSKLAETIPGVESVEGWTEYAGTLVSENKDEAGTQIVFVAPPATSKMIDPVINSGRWLAPGDENAVVIGNHLLAIFPDLQVGDWLSIEIDGKETQWHIVGVYTLVGNTTSPLLYVNYEYLSELVGAPGKVYSLRIITDRHDVETQRHVSNQLEALYEANGIRVDSSQLGANFIEDQQAQTDVLVYFMLVMAVLIAVVGGLGLTGTMSINTLERTREIGVMRAIGASNMDIQGIVQVEGMAIGIIAWGFSILLSIPITNILTFGVGMAILTAPMPPAFGVTGVIVWLIFTLVLTVLASALPARRASRLTVRDTLAYE
jgi:putative ABC transport system permease protein